MAKISQEEYRTLSSYIYKLSGIDLGQGKEYLVESRLNPVLISLGLHSFSELYYQARVDKSGDIEKKIVDAISTNETFWFRDNAAFEQLKYRIVPELVDKKGGTSSDGGIELDIWSAACSTGQEVYSIAISLLELLGEGSRHKIRILGTDISQQAIAQASYGKYNKLEIERGLPQHYLRKYFHQAGNSWRINDRVRSMVKFEQMNLMHPFPGIGPFDVIFCRYVAIYFSQADKRRLFQKMAGMLRPEGYLILGGTESLSGIAPQFESRHYLGGIYYQLQPAQAAAAQQRPNSRAAPEGRLGNMRGGVSSPGAAKRDPSLRPSSSSERGQKQVPGRKTEEVEGGDKDGRERQEKDRSGQSGGSSREQDASADGEKGNPGGSGGSLLARLQRQKGSSDSDSSPDNGEEKEKTPLLRSLGDKKEKKGE